MLNSLKTLLLLHSLTAGCIIRTCLASTCDLESQATTKTIKTKSKKCWENPPFNHFSFSCHEMSELMLKDKSLGRKIPISFTNPMSDKPKSFIINAILTRNRKISLLLCNKNLIPISRPHGVTAKIGTMSIIHGPFM